MKQVLVNVPDGKIDFFYELLENLGFEEEEQYDISNEDKELVMSRLDSYRQDPSKVLSFQQLEEKIHFKNENL